MSLKEQTRQLWKQCFDDSEAFIDLYFGRRYSDAINHVRQVDGQVVAALQAVPYDMTFGAGYVVPVAYVSGACTHPDHRCRGEMHRLLAETHRSLYAQGKWFSTLIPANEGLFGYYARSGYAACFHRTVENVVINRGDTPVDNSERILEISSIELLKSFDEPVGYFINEQLLQRPCCIQHTVDDLQVVCHDIWLDGGCCLRIERERTLVGLAFCVPLEDAVWKVKELVLAEGVDCIAALRQIARHCGASRLTAGLPPCPTRQQKIGMARVLRVGEALHRYACLYPSCRRTLQVTGDVDIPENNGYYRLQEGDCHCGFEASATYEVLTISELTAWLLEGLSPTMSLMLD